jgi:hypothetical protein
LCAAKPPHGFAEASQGLTIQLWEMSTHA